MKKLFLKSCIIILFLISPVYAGVDFDGIDDFLSSTDGNTCDFEANTEDFSISVWVKSDDVLNYNAIIYKVDANNDFWRLIQNDDGTIRASINTIDESSVATITQGSWHSVIATFDRDGDMIVYVDGVASGGTALNGELMSLDSQLIEVGFLSPGGGDQFWNGQITEVAIYEKVLSSTEIELLSFSMVKRMPLQIGSLCFYIPIDDEPDGTSGDGDTFIDISPNGFNASGDDGANNTGLTVKGEEVLSYPPY